MVQIKILCLDQATKVTGYSVWTNGKLKKYGTIHIEPEKGESYIDRLCRMASAIDALVKNTKPDFVCIEDVQQQSNPHVFKVLSQLQGYLFAILDRMKLPFVVVEPMAWKSNIGVTSKKRQDQKAQTVEIIKDKYKIAKLTEDEADAIGIGCWAILNIRN